MTETLEGVRDPLRVSSDHDNVALRTSILPKGHDDTVCPVDGDGVVRYPEGHHRAGEPVPWGAVTVIEYGVDPETWGEQYHHPVDCPEGDGRLRSTCGGCTVAAEKEGR